jgi:hypothetical protein
MEDLAVILEGHSERKNFRRELLLVRRVCKTIKPGLHSSNLRCSKRGISMA